MHRRALIISGSIALLLALTFFDCLGLSATLNALLFLQVLVYLLGCLVQAATASKLPGWLFYGALEAGLLLRAKPALQEARNLQLLAKESAVRALAALPLDWAGLSLESLAVTTAPLDGEFRALLSHAAVCQGNQHQSARLAECYQQQVHPYSGFPSFHQPSAEPLPPANWAAVTENFPYNYLKAAQLGENLARPPPTNEQLLVSILTLTNNSYLYLDRMLHGYFLGAVDALERYLNRFPTAGWSAVRPQEVGPQLADKIAKLSAADPALMALLSDPNHAGRARKLKSWRSTLRSQPPPPMSNLMVGRSLTSSTARQEELLETAALQRMFRDYQAAVSCLLATPLGRLRFHPLGDQVFLQQHLNSRYLCDSFETLAQYQQWDHDYTQAGTAARHRYRESRRQANREGSTDLTGSADLSTTRATSGWLSDSCHDLSGGLVAEPASVQPSLSSPTPSTTPVPTAPYGVPLPSFTPRQRRLLENRQIMHTFHQMNLAWQQLQQTRNQLWSDWKSC